jgi:hypothetical protein
MTGRHETFRVVARFHRGSLGRSAPAGGAIGKEPLCRRDTRSEP